MAEYLIQGSTLQGIADAIRSKTKSTNSIAVSEMTEAINSIRSPVEEETTIELDFSEGDMIIEPSEDIVFNKVTIRKPENLISENIAKNVNIAGVIGNIVGGGGGQLEGDFFKYAIFNLDNENMEVIVYGFLWSKLYADTGKYDLNIPDTLGAYQVVISSEGVV